jgi:hypothetical protein
MLWLNITGRTNLADRALPSKALIPRNESPRSVRGTIYAFRSAESFAPDVAAPGDAYTRDYSGSHREENQTEEPRCSLLI